MSKVSSSLSSVAVTVAMVIFPKTDLTSVFQPNLLFPCSMLYCSITAIMLRY